MASRKEYEMLFQLNAQLGSSYSSTFRDAQGSITSMQNEIAALTRTQSDISAYQKQQDAVEKSQKKLEVLQQQYDNIQKEMQETGTFSSALENKLLAKQQQIDKTSNSLETQTHKLETMGNRLKDAGVDTGNLTGESARLGSEIDELKDKQEEAADEAKNFGSTASSAFSAAGQALVAAGITVALKEIVDWFNSTTDASIEYESAMTGVAKTTDMSSEELQAMAKEIRSLATEIPITTSEFAEVAEVAGQLGIAKESLMDFSTVMSMLATATTMTADDAATMLAQFANITQMDPSYYSNLASTIVELGNNYATTEQKITEMSQGIAASASLAGMSEADMVALSAAVTSLGIETQAGSTSMSKLISELMTAVETGDQLTEFASIANMTAEEFSAAWGDDAVRALEAFVTGLSDTERNGKSATVALTELGITETRMQRMILSLSNSGDLLNRTIETSTNAWDENTALITEAELRYGTTASQLTLMENAYNNLLIVIGDQFTPELRTLYGAQTDVLKTVTDYIEENPELIKAVTAFLGVLGLATGGIVAYTTATKIAIPLMTSFGAAIPGVNLIMGVTVAMAALTAGIVAINAATDKHVDESWELTAASREQHLRLEELNAEYERAVAVHGETSGEAAELRYQVNQLTGEYESGKQTFTEYQAEHEKLVKSYDSMVDAQAETAREMDLEQRNTVVLINKLGELSATTESAVTNKQAILSIIEQLNRQMPELALNYDDVAQSSEGFIDSIYSIAEAQAAQMKLEQQYQDYITLVGSQDALKTAKEVAEYNAKVAQEHYDIALAAYNDTAKLFKHDVTGISGWFGTRVESRELDKAKEQLDFELAALEKAGSRYEDNTARIIELQEAFDAYRVAQEEVALAGGNVSEVISSVTQEVEQLTAAYNEAYDAALESVAGQYSLWDEAAEVVAISTGELNFALESQTKYWQEYNANLEKLSGRTGEIEGLSELLATFADGSGDSVNMIAGLAQATDAEIRTMVEKWHNLQLEHQTVAQSLAQLETDFAASMATLQAELEGAIGEMDLGEEAAERGRSTVEGFIKGSEDMLPAVSAAYDKIAKAAVAAIDAQLQIESPSRVFAERGEYAMSGFAGGVSDMEPEVMEAMSGAAMKSYQAFAEGMRLGNELHALSSPMAAVSAITSSPGASGAPASQPIEINFNISGVGSTPELETMLVSAGQDLKRIILDILEDREIDRQRTAYV